MKIIYNKLLPLGDLDAMTVLCWLFVKRPAELTPRLYNHEKIHLRQQFEILVACFVAIALCVWLLDISAWWLMLSVPMPFLIYGFSVFIELFLPPWDQAYRSSCFETEAIYNEHDINYTQHWWRHLFAWVRYISNTKYPYLPQRKRPEMQ